MKGFMHYLYRRATRKCKPNPNNGILHPNQNQLNQKAEAQESNKMGIKPKEKQTITKHNIAGKSCNEVARFPRVSKYWCCLLFSFFLFWSGCMYLCMGASMYACIYVCIYVCMYRCMYVFLSAGLSGCMYVSNICTHRCAQAQVSADTYRHTAYTIAYRRLCTHAWHTCKHSYMRAYVT